MRSLCPGSLVSSPASVTTLLPTGLGRVSASAPERQSRIPVAGPGRGRGAALVPVPWGADVVRDVPPEPQAGLVGDGVGPGFSLWGRFN